MTSPYSLVIVVVGAVASGGCAALVGHLVVSPRLHASWVRGRMVDAGSRTDVPIADRIDLADFLDALGRTVRAGSSVPAALVSRTANASHLPTWLRDVVRRTRLGDVPRASHGTSGPRDREGRIAFRAVVLAGMSRHEPLEHGASLIRLERSLLAERRAAIAPVRASVRILTVAPIVVLTWLSLRSPEVRSALVGTPVGVGSLVVGVALQLCGRWWMDRIVAGAIR